MKGINLQLRQYLYQENKFNRVAKLSECVESLRKIFKLIYIHATYPVPSKFVLVKEKLFKISTSCQKKTNKANIWQATTNICDITSLTAVACGADVFNEVYDTAFIHSQRCMYWTSHEAGGMVRCYYRLFMFSDLFLDRSSGR